MGANVSTAKQEDAGNILADQIVKLMRDLKVPNGLRELGYESADIPALVEGTLPQHRVTKLSPRPAGPDELARLFEESMTKSGSRGVFALTFYSVKWRWMVEASEAQNRLAKYRGELDHLKTAVDLAFGENVASNVAMPEDRVVFPLGVASRDLFEEIHFLVHHGLGKTLRCALLVLSMSASCLLPISVSIPSHGESYVDTMYAQWANVLRNVPDAVRTLPDDAQ